MGFNSGFKGLIPALYNPFVTTHPLQTLSILWSPSPYLSLLTPVAQLTLSYEIIINNETHSNMPYLVIYKCESHSV